jgi:hypothetical protein
MVDKSVMCLEEITVFYKLQRVVAVAELCARWAVTYQATRIAYGTT